MTQQPGSTSTASDPRTAAERQLIAYSGLLDSRYVIPGTSIRFGLDSVLGLVPGLGDGLGLVLSLATLGMAMRLGARGWVLARMIANVAIDAVLGAIPLLGSVFDFVFKANDRNVALLQRYVESPAQVAAVSRRQVVLGVLAVAAICALLVVGFVATVWWLLSR